MKFVGITGGVGAGKTEILKFLAEQEKIEVMLADEIAHELMEPDGACYEKLKELFAGDAVFGADGKIERNRMAEVIFSDAAKREKLNDIVHPAVKTYVMERVKKEREKKELHVLVLEAALLIEEGYDSICDELWYIYTTEENREKRLMQNRGYSKEKVAQIFKSQLTEETYRKYCRVVIDNNGTKEDAVRQVAELLKRKEYQL
mgnify:FL=1